MSHERHHRVKALFLAALEQPFARRVSFVAEHAAGDREVQREVLELLLLHRSTDSIIDAPPDPTMALARFAERTGERAGRWWLRQELGRGGMGVVYLADDADGRVAAVKLLASGIITPETRERFRLEAEILSRLSHPGLARILDPGQAPSSLDDARPWIAMEFVDGRPLLEFALEQELTLAQRLELLTRVCDAVQHAHAQGIVHRDLKPSNILVGADGHPVVLDFGVARLTSGDERPTELLTRTGQLVGTPQYMSPEQVSEDSTSIGPQSDVYSLGVIAYELLTGALPYAASNVSLHRAVVSILTVEPRPLREVAPQLRGPLERIVAMALEKRAQDRYPDAGALGDDLRRQLEGRSVRARGPGLGRRITRWSKRRKRFAIGLGSVLLAVLMGAAWWLGKGPPLSREQIRARYHEAERLAYQMVSLLYEGERTPVRLRAAIESGDSARKLIEDIPRLRHYPLLIRYLRKELGTARFLLGDMTWDIGELREAMVLLNDAITNPVDTLPGWEADLQSPQLNLRCEQRDLVGLQGGAIMGAHRLWGEWATATGAVDSGLESRRLLQAELGAPAPPESLTEEHAHNDPYALCYNGLAQAHVDYARYGGNPRVARLALSYSDSAYARVIAFTANWPAYGSLLFERGRAFRTVAVTNGVPADLDSAASYLIASEEFRGPGRARVCAETRAERAALRLDQCRMAPTRRLGMRFIRAARADVDSAIVLLRSVSAAAPAVAELHSLLADVFIEQALIERGAAALDSASRHLDIASAVFQPSNLPRAAGLLLTQRAHLEAARTELLGQDPAVALRVVERAEQFARSPRNDSLVIQRANDVRRQLEDFAAR